MQRNIQNIPKEPGLREAYNAPDGKVLISCDFGMEEIVTLAATLKARYGKSRMADAVNAGLCLHSLFAAKRDGVLNDIDLDRMAEPEVAKVIKERIAPYKVDKELKKHRQQAKMAKLNWPTHK